MCSLSLAAALRLLTVESALVQSTGSGHRLQQLQLMGSAALAPGPLRKDSTGVPHGLSCFMVWGIFPDRGLNLSLLHWQVGSLPLSHQESPELFF